MISLGNKWVFFGSLTTLLLAPHLLFVALPANSLAIGVALSLLILFFLNLPKVIRINFSWIPLAAAFGIISILLFLSLPSFFRGNEKPASSLILLLFVILWSYFFSKILLIYDSKDLDFGFSSAFYLVLFIGWLSLIFGFDIGAYENYPKAVLPFSEESHYALTVGLLGSVAGANRNNWFRLFSAVNILLQAIFFPSLALLLFFFILILVYWGRGKLFFFLIGSPLIAFGAWLLVEFFAGEWAVSYFSDRLNFSDNAKNLTALVYLQGWLDAWTSLRETNGLGLGFQMLGTNPPNEITLRILNLYGVEFNREDGGFLAAKIIAEFGVFGVFLVLAYFVFLLKYAFSARSRHQKGRDLMFSTCIFSFMVEFFFRGYGYFSPGLVLVASCFMAKISGGKSNYSVGHNAQ